MRTKKVKNQNYITNTTIKEEKHKKERKKGKIQSKYKSPYDKQ